MEIYNLVVHRFGATLTALRTSPSRAMSMEDLARAANVTMNTISRGSSAAVCPWKPSTLRDVLVALSNASPFTPEEQARIDEELNRPKDASPPAKPLKRSAPPRGDDAWFDDVASAKGERYALGVLRVAEAMVNLMGYDDGQGGTAAERIDRLKRRMSPPPRTPHTPSTSLPKPPPGAVRTDRPNGITEYTPIAPPAKPSAIPPRKARRA